MPDNYLEELSFTGAKQMLDDYIRSGEVGIGVWNITQQKFSVIEQITNRPRKTVESAVDFIREIADPKDIKMALMELETYLNSPTGAYRSSFRIKSDDVSSQWILLKGKTVVDEETSDRLFYIVFYDVTGNKFETGNDKKTNLIDRNFFVKKLGGALAHQNPKEKTGVIRLGMNNYKEIKDIYGVQVVDELVQEMAIQLTNLFPIETELARFSNDTFIGMVPNYKEKEYLVKLTDKIIQAFKKPFKVNQQSIRVEISLGVTNFPEQGQSVEEILLHSEYATQQSRQRGDYVTTFFNSELAGELHKNILLDNALADAIENKSFQVAYQPQIHSETGKVVGVEALARWQHPQFGFVSPATFIPMVEKHGLMPQLGRLILDEAIQTAKNWLANNYDFGHIGINVSPVELLHEDFLSHLLQVCEKYNFPPDKLEVEITEGIYLKSIGNSEQIINDLNNHGFRIAIDDFGTGYSNLSFISHAKLHTVKIDKSLIDKVEDTTGYIVVEGIVNGAKKLDYWIVAEGVETKKQVDLLRQMNCHHVQGYYYSKPLSAGEMDAFIEERS